MNENAIMMTSEMLKFLWNWMLTYVIIGIICTHHMYIICITCHTFYKCKYYKENEEKEIFVTKCISTPPLNTCKHSVSGGVLYILKYYQHSFIWIFFHCQYWLLGIVHLLNIWNGKTVLFVACNYLITNIFSTSYPYISAFLWHLY